MPPFKLSGGVRIETGLGLTAVLSGRMAWKDEAL
jgi:hypothetical protein